MNDSEAETENITKKKNFKTDKLVCLVYTRAKELAKVLYTDYNCEGYRNVIRECLYGQDLDRLKTTHLVEMLEEGVID